MNDLSKTPARRARLIHSPEGPAVLLPKGFEFASDEADIRWEDGRIILEPVRIEEPWTLEELRALIAEGEDESGDAPWNAKEVVRDGLERLAAERRG